ncbi:MAG TPA: CHAT domain-containing protein, partial [Allocoleopsis sp.]
ERIEVLEEVQPFFQNLMRLFVSVGNEEEALLIAEKSKARAFSDLLAARLAPNEVVVAATEPTTQQVQEIARTQNATLVEYTIICEDNQTSEVCEADRATKLFIWVVKPTGEIEFQQVSLRSLTRQNMSLGDLIYNTRTAIGQQLVNSEITDPSSDLRHLYQVLIQPISHLLPSDPDSHVIFVPNRELLLVPFSALIDNGGNYLIEKHTISFAPSIQVLDSTSQLRQRNAGVATGVLAVGNPTVPSESDQQSDAPLPSLIAWEQGARDIAKQFNTQALIGEEATKANVLRLMPQSRIIHLAAHAGFDDSQGLNSWIALAASGNDNGRLTAGELFDLYAPPDGRALHAELIVLAACDTGRGQITGDGVIGLSRSLIAAGIPSVIVSQWTVPENPTIFLMKKFYTHL